MTRNRTPPRPVSLVREPHSASQDLTLYLLCAERPLGRVRHYLGITRTERLAQRLREHAHRRGSSLTAALARRNDTLELVRLWHGASWDQERRIKRRGHYRRLCPVCQGASRDSAIQRIPCPDLEDLAQAPENVGLGLPLRGVQGRPR